MTGWWKEGLLWGRYWCRKCLSNWLMLDHLFNDLVEHNFVLLQGLGWRDLGPLKELSGVVEAGVPVDVCFEKIWERSSLAFPLYQIYDAVHHSFLAVGIPDVCQIVALLLVEWVVESEICVDPNLGLTLAIEANHIVRYLSRTEFVTEPGVSFQGVVKDDVGFLEAELPGIAEQGGNPFGEDLDVLL